jgi:hypothetical protein
MIVKQGIVMGVAAIKPLAFFEPECAMKSGLGKRLFLHIVKIID